jgi:hypothetical protein
LDVVEAIEGQFLSYVARETRRLDEFGGRRVLKAGQALEGQEIVGSAISGFAAAQPRRN